MVNNFDILIGVKKLYYWLKIDEINLISYIHLDRVWKIWVM
jgi:hypothetical protein